LVKGFRARSGRTFEARLKLEEGAVRFDFGSGSERPSHDPQSDRPEVG
jgi:hypothetical protein